MMKRKTILYWFIGWAGLFVAILYSPMGSPDLYNTNMGYNISGNVSFSNVDFSHAPSKGRGIVSDVSAGQPELTPISTSNVATGVGQVRMVDGSQNGYISGASSTGRVNSTPSGSVSMGGAGNVAASGRSSGSSGNTSVAEPSGAIAMSSDLQGPVVRQGATNAGGGLAQPDLEGDNPGTMIPIGDNLIVLLMLALGYATIKIFRHTR